MFLLKKWRYLAYFLGMAICSEAFARSVYMNGVDISSARNQNLAKVNIRIDENGNIFIEAPHYQVNEEYSFTPLSSWMESLSTPEHKTRSAMPHKDAKVVPSIPSIPADEVKADAKPEVEKEEPNLQNKAGTKIGG